jgi:hypothetical protein
MSRAITHHIDIDKVYHRVLELGMVADFVPHWSHITLNPNGPFSVMMPVNQLALDPGSVIFEQMQAESVTFLPMAPPSPVVQTPPVPSPTPTPSLPTNMLELARIFVNPEHE